ncbi:type VII secretion integral membrane protein EccD [Natronoglycomyces albus]|uniref:Type VII secretion integral membrane protein EccD n=1 Tax=Natronoglycomyces albus TaxID=2811108 RepID=A0A895XQM4_9ACTN|nr:type VII secretion integral membrane protein EccD [Natronoglycomyces albus]QSB06012.1 type VII secretion integral membrane protein EccD [Natronoglycomyces albus]
MSSKAATLSRVTIVSPKTRIDLALPSDVPLADLLPTILHQAGEYYLDEAAENGGWILSKLGDQPLDTGHTCSQLSLHDGELLYLTPANDAKPEIVFDDVIDAIATATENRGNRWDHRATKRFSVMIGTLAMMAGATAIALTGPPHLPGALVALSGAAVLIGACLLLSRAVGDSRAATYFGLTAVAYAGVGGLLVAAGDLKLTELSAPHVLMAAATVLLFSVLAMLSVGDSSAIPVFMTTLLSSIVLTISVGAMMLIPGATASTGAAIAAPLALALIPAAPKVSLAIASVPTPQLPNTTEELKAGDDEPVDGKRVLSLSERAADYLAAIYSFVAIVAGIAAGVLAFSGHLTGPILGAVIGLVLMSRSRTIDDRAARIVVMTAGMLALGTVITAIFIDGGLLVRLVAILGALVLVTLIAMVYGLAVAGKKLAPTWGRLLDIAEALLIVSILPLVGWATGLFAWGLTLRG